MILEVAILTIKSGQSPEFEKAFQKAAPIIQRSPGYISHQMQKCIEKENQYILLVQWKTIEDHEVGFRGSIAYQEWKRLLHHFYEPFPEVLHYTNL